VPPQTVEVSALGGLTPVPVTEPGIAWSIDAGTTLVIDTGANQEAVSVLAVNPHANPPTVAAVFTRPHPAGAPISLADVPGAPPILLKPVAVTRAASFPQTSSSLTVTLAVDPGQSNAATLAGRYDGIPWTIRPGAKLILDVGANQEVVTVEPGPFALDPAAGIGSFRVVVTRPHAEGFVITNTLLGNPGPQAKFNPRDPAFSAVVRYRSVIQ
jgi:hypothetical protein